MDHVSDMHMHAYAAHAYALRQMMYACSSDIMNPGIRVYDDVGVVCKQRMRVTSGHVLNTCMPFNCPIIVSFQEMPSGYNILDLADNNYRMKSNAS